MRSCVVVFLPLSGLFCVCVSFLWVVLLHLFPINLPPWGVSGNAFHFGFAFTSLDDYFSLAQPPRPFFFLGGGGRGGCIQDYISKSACPLKLCCVYLCAPLKFPQSASVACLAAGPKPAVPHISPCTKLAKRRFV